MAEKKDKIKGGFADGKSPEDIAKKHGISVDKINDQLKMGKKVEMEHVDDYDLAEEIALDHLFEIPDYYTRLDKMEKEAEKEMEGKKKEVNESKENITEFAKRMRELAGLSENQEKKALKTIQEGIGQDEIISYVYEDSYQFASSKEDGVEFNSLEEAKEWAKNKMKAQRAYRSGTKDMWASFIVNGKELLDERISEKDMVNESQEIENEFETHKFEQKTIEEGENDQELYNLNENTIIVLDFLDDEDEE